MQADTLLLVHPAAWQSATTNYAAFKKRLGFAVTNISVESVGGGAGPGVAAMRAWLTDYRLGLGASNGTAYVLFLGNFNTIPAPIFRVTTNANTFKSDIVYRDLHTEFDADGDGVYGEYSASGGEDFEDATFPAVFTAISNDLIVGRMPFDAVSQPETISTALAHCMAFERETGARKSSGFLTAGRIMTWVTGIGELPADSWDYVVKQIAVAVTNNFSGKQITTVVHVASNYTDRTGIDHAVEGDAITGDYDRGQDIVRSLWENNDNFSFLCNCSHGGSNYDFALRRNGAGLPSGVHPGVVISMSCASFLLGRSAFLEGLAVSYLGSTATVTPDVENIVLWGGKMVSGEVQKMAVMDIFCNSFTIGEAFAHGFDYYIDTIPSAGLGVFFSRAKSDILRNISGFQIIGDPTLVLAYPDSDTDGLLDAEERTIGTGIDNPDSDGDGLPDGLEFETAGFDALVHNGEDVDYDGSCNADELVAGTSPFDDFDYLAFDGFAVTSGILAASWHGVSGRVYELYLTTDLLSEAWDEAPGFGCVTGSGTIVCHTNAMPPESACFYRIGVRLQDP